MLKRLVLIALLLVPLEVPAASVYLFTGLTTAKGYQGPVVVSVVWASGSARDVSQATGTVKVYSTPPTGGAGGTVKFTSTATS